MDRLPGSKVPQTAFGNSGGESSRPQATLSQQVSTENLTGIVSMIFTKI